MSTELADDLFDRHFELSPHVAVRREPFGALAYNCKNRRLVFLRHPDVVRVVTTLGDHLSLAATLDACNIARHRWPAFLAAVCSLVDSEVIRER